MIRGQGVTTNQIKNAPENSIFVWCNNETHYPKSLCRQLNRTDLEVWSRSKYFREKRIGLRGYKGVEFILDHAMWVTE